MNEPTLRNFHGKVALVTSAGSGIGRAATQLFAQRGARLTVVDIDEAGSRETVDLTNFE